MRPVVVTNAIDEHAERYDGWFIANHVQLQSELLLIKSCLAQAPGRALSIGCGSGVCELLLRRDHGVSVGDGVEWSGAMIAVARMRGLAVHVGSPEALPLPNSSFDTVLFNRSPSVIGNLGQALTEAFRVLRPEGCLVLADVPKESAYSLLCELAVARGSWTHAGFADITPRSPYPVELAATLHQRTTPEKALLVAAAGFVGLHYVQTLTRHPLYSNDSVEEPSEGFERGGYVAICATKPRPAA